MKRSVRVLAGFAATLVCSLAHAADRPAYHAAFDPAVSNSVAPPTVRSSAGRARDALVAHRDPRTGAPTFAWGSATTAPPPAGIGPEQAARDHLAAYAEVYGVAPGALASLELDQVHDVGRGGIVVTFLQVVDGVPLFHHHVKLLLRRDLSLVAIAGAPHPAAVSSPKAAGVFALSQQQALSKALLDLYSVKIEPASLVEHGEPTAPPYARWDLGTSTSGPKGALRFDRPARVRPVLFPLPDRLVPGFYVELFARELTGIAAVGDAYGYVVSARDGSILYRASLKQSDSYGYRVFADAAGDVRPTDGPIADFTPHPTGTPDGSYPAFAAPALVTIEGFNQFTDPWLPPAATETLGNNVDAYTDHDNPDGFSAGDLRATTTSAGVFDRVYDVTKPPLDSPAQSMASVTDLFYVNNWLHDWFYDSGFDEVAGNAQQSNYGRGGAEGDPLHAEAQDGVLIGSKNNANMSTPEDGAPPRMQMYVWDGKDIHSLHITPPNQDLTAQPAGFGPQNFNLSAGVVLGDDGSGTVTDACQNIVNNVAGKIVLVDRGTCTFESKAQRVENAGGVGLLVANNQPAGLPGMGDDGAIVANIPAFGISQADGTALKASLMNGAVTATMARVAAVDVDGTIDNTVVAHEWGHFIHHRLVSCGLSQCGGQSEGWGDFNALMMTARAGDNVGGTFAAAIYASIATDNAGYFGIRRMPYSTDMAKNPLTFKHITTGEPLPNGPPMSSTVPDNAEVHNTGEVWATMLWEGYASMLAAAQGASPPYTFAEARRRMADYVVAGMKLAPQEPTFTEQRDGILAAAYTADAADGLLLAQGFAKRGAGSCAVSPAKDSTDNSGVVESFTLAPDLVITGVTVDDGVSSCDNDGILDAGETGHVTVDIVNRGGGAAQNTLVTIDSATVGFSFPNGTQITLPDLTPYTTGKAVFEVTIDPAVTPAGPLDFSLTVDNAAGCTPSVGLTSQVAVDYDNVPGSSATDTFESDLDIWTTEGTKPDAVWQRIVDLAPNHVWHGTDVAGITDTALVSPPVPVGNAGPLVLSFNHRHQFETSNGPTIYWDGGVVEITTDAGANWQDVSGFGAIGYGGTLSNQANNPLSDRNAFVDQNASWPAFDAVTVDLGSGFAGQTVQIRFRLGTDEAASAFGWEIDDVALQGITTTPFPTVTADGTVCPVPLPPTANAGPDQTVTEGDMVTLDASATTEPDGDPLTFTWSQTVGPNVVLAPATAMATFTAPPTDAPVDLTFEVKVDDKDGSSTDTVVVHVLPIGGSGGGGGGTGGGGTGGDNTGGDNAGGDGTGANGGDGTGANGTGGSGTPAGNTTPDFGGLAADGGGCDCSTGSSPISPASTAAAVGLALAALARRRRRRG